MSQPPTVASRVAVSRRIQWALLILAVAAFGLRCHDLEAKSLWTDEGLTVRRAEQPLSLLFKNQNLIPVEPNYHDGTEVEMVATPDVHPPLYFLFMHVWIRGAGRSEFALRFPSVMASVLAVPLLFALGSALLTRETGLWAALLAASSPFYIWHAQEARMYAWVVLLSAASVYMFLALLRDAPRPGHYLAYAAATSALVYTHYTGFLLVAFEVIIYAAYQFKKGMRPVLVVIAVLAVASVPLIPYVRRVLSLSFHGFLSPSLPVLLAQASSYFSLGGSEFLGLPLWQTGPFVALFGIGALMLDVPRRRRAWMVCLGHLAIPMLLFHLISYFKPNYMNPRHFLIVNPAWDLVVAQGLITLRRRFWPGLAILLSLSLVFRGRANYEIFTSRRMWKDDIRGAARYIEERARPGDAIVLHDPVIRLTFDYYYDGPYPEAAIPRYGENDEQQAIDRFAGWAQHYDRIWFLYGPPPTHFPRDLLPQWADANLFKVCHQGFEAMSTYVAVAAYDDEAPVLDALPLEADSCDVNWGSLRLVGFRAKDTMEGSNHWLEFFWQADEGQLDRPLILKARLLDSGGTVWYERQEEVLPFYPPSAWPPYRTVRTDFRLPLPYDVPPVTYTVEVVPVGLGDFETVGQMTVTDSTQSSPAPCPSARFEGSLELLDGELGSDVFRAGHVLFGSLTWRATAQVDSDYRLRVRLTNLWGRQVAVREMRPSAAGFPTSAWIPGDPVAGRFSLRLPPDLNSGLYRVEIGLIDESTGRPLGVQRWYGKKEWLSLGSVRVEDWPLMTNVPDDVDHRLDQIEIAGKVNLRGYDLAREDDTLMLTLYWQAQSPLERSYHVFVHVGMPNRPPLADAGGVPAEWTRPTTSWRRGEVIVDDYALSLSDVPPGRYQLFVGFYEPDTGQRPETVVDDTVIPGGYVLLEEIDVR